MKIVLVAKPGHEDTGVGRYTRKLHQELEALGHDVLIVHPIVPLPNFLVRGIHRFLGWDLTTFFQNYPVWAKYPQADIYHLTSQNLATLLRLCKPPGPTIITVHDIIPWQVRKKSNLRTYNHIFDEWLDWLALQSLGRADKLIADSYFTKRSFCQAIQNVVIDDNMTVIMLGVH